MNTILKKSVNILVIALLIFSATDNVIADSGVAHIKFLNSDLEKAKERASSEGKMVFVDFYASWCTPCKWMDQTTFKDENVVKMLNENFIAVKMNIDKPEGFEMKNKYEVQYLPTILIFNSHGKLIERIEETLTAADLNTLLESHNNHDNKKVITNAVNASPKEAQRTYEPAEVEDNSFSMSNSDYNRYRDTEQSVYRVQVGVYKEYAGAAKQVAYLRETFFESVIVKNDYRGEHVLFKVLLGQFETIEEAESFRKILARDFNMEAIIN